MNKYLISADIEGITGVANKEFSKEGGRYYQHGCRYMVSDVNAVVQGIINADPDAEIVVRDAHGASAVNIDLEKLHPKASLVQGWAAVQNMLTGLDEDFKGVFLVGYHAGGDSIRAVLGHTMHSIIRSVKVNGLLLNEAGLFGLYAGYHNVPVAFISGDNYAIKEAWEQLGDIVGVVVKESYGRGCAKSLSLEQARMVLEKNASDAVTGLKQNKFQTFKIPGPVTLELKLYDSGVRISIFQNLSEILAFDQTYKFDSQKRTVTFEANDELNMLERLNMLMFLIYSIG